MKNIYRILVIAAISAFFASCDRTDKYVGADGLEYIYPFVTFDVKTSYSVSEDIGHFTIPVRLVNPAKLAFNVTLSGVDGDAINGVNYTISEPENGVLSFSAKDTLKYITIDVTRIPDYNEPGYLKFAVTLDAATNGIAIGAFNKVNVTITDADHPLADILGNYTAVAEDYFDGNTSWTTTLSSVEGDVTSVRIIGLTPSFVGMYDPATGVDYSFVAEVSGEPGSRTFSVPFGTPYVSAVNSNIVSLWGFDGTYVYSEGDLVFLQQPDGSIVFEDDWGFGIGYRTATGGISVYDLILPGAVLTKE